MLELLPCCLDALGIDEVEDEDILADGRARDACVATEVDVSEEVVDPGVGGVSSVLVPFTERCCLDDPFLRRLFSASKERFLACPRSELWDSREANGLYQVED